MKTQIKENWDDLQTYKGQKLINQNKLAETIKTINQLILNGQIFIFNPNTGHSLESKDLFGVTQNGLTIQITLQLKTKKGKDALK